MCYTDSKEKHATGWDRKFFHALNFFCDFVVAVSHTLKGI